VAQLIQFVKPTLRRKDMQAVLQTMVDEKIGPGERKKEFLSEISLRLGMKSGIALRSYFQALLNGLVSLGVTQGSKILTSVLAPSIYGIAAEKLGAHLILCDINKENGCISTESALDAIHKDGGDFLLLHEPYAQIPYGEDYSNVGLPILEDITESIGSSFEDLQAGSIGDLVICAFEEDHVLSCGGGAVLLYRNDRYKSIINSVFRGIAPFEELPDMNAALGIVQLANFDAFLKRRREISRLFRTSLLKTDHKQFGNGSLDFETNGWNFPVILDSKYEDVIKFAKKYNVSCQKMFVDSLGYPLKSRYPSFPQALPTLLRSVAFPLYPFLKGSEVDTMVKVISHLP